MADLTQTAANVRCGSDSLVSVVQAGEAISAGQPVYKSTDGKYYLADANDSTKTNCSAIALTNASTDDYVVVQTGGTMNIGATTVAGQLYVLSGNVGKIAPASDLTTGWYPVTLGAATDATGSVALNIDVGTVAHS